MCSKRGIDPRDLYNIHIHCNNNILLHMHTSHHEYNIWKQCIHCFIATFNTSYYSATWSYYPGGRGQEVMLTSTSQLLPLSRPVDITNK